MAYPLLNVGQLYTKVDLADIISYDSLRTVREGIHRLQKGDGRTVFLFVDLEKTGKKDRFHFDDYFEGEWFHWDSQTTQSLDSPSVQAIINGHREIHLFCRLQQKINNLTQPFVYCGELGFSEYDPKKVKPAHLIFRSLDYQDGTENKALLSLYRWKPGDVGASTSNVLNKSGVVSEQRSKNYTKPTRTERRGLVTSRVGQGYYRQQVRDKWRDTCPVTGISLPEILIASHIKAWKDSSESERLDPDNGILLSPAIDALFDRHLITFDASGYVRLSPELEVHHYERLGVTSGTKIPVDEGMKPYLAVHEKKFAIRKRWYRQNH